MAAKHFINDPTKLVVTALRSIPRTNPSVALDEENKIIYIRPGGAERVSVISGGGSGHEPSFAAFVGHGLLSAAVAGSIFASPSAEQVRRCLLQKVGRAKGILVVVMNYTGDILNFGMAVEKAKAAGIAVEMLVVGDDVGVGRAKGGRIGRRGIAGTVLVQKIAGALSVAGASLEDVRRVAELATVNLVSVGASLSHVHVPGRTEAQISELTIGNNEVEIGMGIHNEEGFSRVQTELAGLVETMLSQLLNPNDKDRAYANINPGDEIILLINNLGGVSPLELGGITEEVCVQLNTTYQISPVRILSGTYMTSLNGNGFSISILKLFDTRLGPGMSLLELIDAPAEAAGWSTPIASSTWVRKFDSITDGLNDDREYVKPSNLTVDPQKVKTVLTSGLNRLIAAEPDVTAYDTIAGDGDCGLALKRGSQAILDFMEKEQLSTDASKLVAQFAQVIEGNMDGTSGALYTIFLNGLSHSISSQNTQSPTAITAAVWGAALQQALKSLGKYTPAQPGDRTLIDALHPFVQTLASSGDVTTAALAAQEGSKSTEGMEASLGRTVYVGGSEYKKCPDPGAYGLSEFLAGLAQGAYPA